MAQLADGVGVETVYAVYWRTWLVDAVDDAWADPEVAWLWTVGDGELLAELGVDVVRTTMALLSTDERFEIRSAEQVGRIVAAVLRQSDRVVAATAGTAAARFVEWARQRAAPALAMIIGDVLGYHPHRAEIQQRVWQTVAEHAGPDAGCDRRHPVHLVGHSLGAVIALDAATATEHAVHTASIVTFGSHWPLLHLWRHCGCRKCRLSCSGGLEILFRSCACRCGGPRWGRPYRPGDDCLLCSFDWPTSA